MLLDNPKSKLLMKNAFWYIGSMFLMKSIGFLTIPIFTRFLTKSEFGEFNNIIAWCSIFTIIVSLDLFKTYPRAKYDFPENSDDYLTTITIIGIVLSGFMFILSFPFFEVISEYFSINSKFLPYVFMFILSQPIINNYQTYNRFTQKPKIFVAVNLAISFSVLLLSVILIINFDVALQGRLNGYIIPNFIAGAYCLFKILTRSTKFKLVFTKYALKIALPFLPFALAQSALSNSYKIIINKSLGGEETAIFSIAFTCAMIVNMLQTALRQAWTPWFNNLLFNKEKQAITTASFLYFFLLVIISIPIIFLGPELVSLLGGEQYISAKFLIPPIMLGCIFLGSCNVYFDIEIYEKRTKGMATATIITALFNFLIGASLIPRYGILAAAYSLMFSYLFLWISHYFVIARNGYSWIFKYSYYATTIFSFIIMTILALLLYNHSLLRYTVLLVIITTLVISGYYYRNKIFNIVNLKYE